MYIQNRISLIHLIQTDSERLLYLEDSEHKRESSVIFGQKVMSQKCETVTNNAPHRHFPGLSGQVTDNTAVKDRSKKEKRMPQNTARICFLVTFGFPAGGFNGCSPSSLESTKSTFGIYLCPESSLDRKQC